MSFKKHHIHHMIWTKVNNWRLSLFKYDKSKFKSKDSKLLHRWIKCLTCPERGMSLRLLGWHLFPVRVLAALRTWKGQTWYLDSILKRRILSANKSWMKQRKLLRNHWIQESIWIANLTDYKANSKLSWIKVLWLTWRGSFSRSNKRKKSRHKTRQWAQVQKNLSLKVLQLWMKLQRVTVQMIRYKSRLVMWKYAHCTNPSWGGSNLSSEKSSTMEGRCRYISTGASTLTSKISAPSCKISTYRKNCKTKKTHSSCFQ